jgi:hypothetical protein
MIINNLYKKRVKLEKIKINKIPVQTMQMRGEGRRA